jgi:hypothetical protein
MTPILVLLLMQLRLAAPQGITARVIPKYHVTMTILSDADTPGTIIDAWTVGAVNGVPAYGVITTITTIHDETTCCARKDLCGQPAVLVDWTPCKITSQ